MSFGQTAKHRTYLPLQRHKREKQGMQSHGNVQKDESYSSYIATTSNQVTHQTGGG